MNDSTSTSAPTITVANQSEADARIPGALDEGPVHLRIEGMEGPIELRKWIVPWGGAQWVCPRCSGHHHSYQFCVFCGLPEEQMQDGPARHARFNGAKHDRLILSVTVSGGEKPVHPQWIRAIRDQCEAAAVPFGFEGGNFTEPCEFSEKQGDWS